MRYYRTDGSEVSCQLLDLEHKVDQPGSDSDRIRVCVRNDEFKWSVDYMLNTSKYFTPVEEDEPGRKITVFRGRYHMRT